ncbi:hypothetical protein MLD38_011771 [Melastoma candidum]|uniref:Uncharacterized protein n=1 Tax=Melastoma candidum TaxID=119954 RepID=A0ACB9R4P6_9MYRT|nr:hypothetical protein MLD38_011771 [Melastoma candidum]
MHKKGPHTLGLSFWVVIQESSRFGSKFYTSLRSTDVVTLHPNVLCDTRIKFGAFMDASSSMGYDSIASGHYAKAVHPLSTNFGNSVLELSEDMVKDQTCFLSHLSQMLLSRLLFPLGCISKEEVRKLAIELYSPDVILVSRHYFSLDKRRHLFRVGSLKWLSGSPPANTVELRCKFIALPLMQTILFNFLHIFPGMDLGETWSWILQLRSLLGHFEDGKEVVAVVRIPEDDQGLASGQFAAFDQGKTCIGSGIILEAWDDKGFPVCTRALEYARMEESTSLGNQSR